MANIRNKYIHTIILKYIYKQQVGFRKCSQSLLYTLPCALNDEGIIFTVRHLLFSEYFLVRGFSKVLCTVEILAHGER